jgi:hypothetical protein
MRSRLILVLAAGVFSVLQAAQLRPDVPDTWHAREEQSVDYLTTGVVEGTSTTSVATADVARLCGDFDGCTLTLFLRTHEPPPTGPKDTIFPPMTARLFVDHLASDWYALDESGSVPIGISGQHAGALIPELIVGFVNNACSFRDDYIPPGTFDLAYGLECVDLFPDIDSYCMLRIED